MPDLDGTPIEAISDSVRDDVLQLTSRLRESLEDLAALPPDPSAFDPVLLAGRNLTRALSRSRLELLVDGGEALEQMAGLAKAVVADQPDAAGAILVGLGRAVGVLERSLDAVIEDGGPALLESLGEALLAAFPEPWSSYLDDPAEADASGEEQQVESAPEEADEEAPATDQDLLDEFEDETADALTRCEELVLRGEEDGFDSALVAALDRELETIQAAADATDLSQAARVLETGRQVLANTDLADADEQAVPPERLAATLLDVVDGVRTIIEHSCGRKSDEHFSGEAVWVEIRSRIADPETAPAASDATTLSFERLFRHVRVALRPQARIDVDSIPDELGIDRKVGARIEGALLSMLRGALGEAPDVASDQPRGASADQPRGVSADQPRGVSADQPRGVSADQPRGVSADGPRPRIGVQVERIGDSTLVVTMEDDEVAADGGGRVDRDVGDPAGNPLDDPGAAPSKPEALHWVDVTKNLNEGDLERLLYRPGFCNVVQILVPPKALRQNAASGAPS